MKLHHYVQSPKAVRGCQQYSAENEFYAANSQWNWTGQRSLCGRDLGM